MDDAGVVQIRDDLALVQTIDIFPPVVDDPWWFGRIAAANSLSDVYAMGARPVSAVNFVGYPIDDLGNGPLEAILAGCFDALEEADCAMAGGHSIKDSEVKFGLAVTGIVHPDRVLVNSGARAGDLLVLTKPLGSGVVTTAMRQGKADPAHVDAAQRLMGRLNRHAAQAMQRAEAHAATDITGYGLLGHAWEMAAGARVAMRIDAERIPLLEEARPYLRPEFTCGGSKRNRTFSDAHVRIADDVPEELHLAVTDVQTSGGLLVAVPAERAAALVEELDRGGDRQAAIVGEVLRGEPGVVVTFGGRLSD